MDYLELKGIKANMILKYFKKLNNDGKLRFI